MDGIEALIKSLPGFSTIGVPGLIAFGVIVLSYIGFKIWMATKDRKNKEQRQADSENEVQTHIDHENPAANTAINNDQNEIDKL